MKSPVILLLTLVSLILTVPVSAQTPSPAPTNITPLPKFWRAVLPGGIYRVRLDKIESVSTHEYNIPPLTHVVEFTVETGGSAVARFYFLETTTPQSPLGQSGIDAIKSKPEEVADRIAGDSVPWKKVAKVYPATTHAHTVEYRVSARTDIDQLMKSIEKAWDTGQGEEIKID